MSKEKKSKHLNISPNLSLVKRTYIFHQMTAAINIKSETRNTEINLPQFNNENAGILMVFFFPFREFSFLSDIAKFNGANPSITWSSVA